MKRILLLVLAVGWTSWAHAQMPPRSSLTVDYQDRKTGQQVVGTDTGRFQEGEPNVIIVPDGTDDSVVCRFRSEAGNCYRLGVSDGKGHVPVTVIDKPGFDMWRGEFQNREGWSICEIIENPWSEWQVHGEIPTAEGTHTYTERRYCSTGGNANACADTCAAEYEERFQTVTNEPSCIDTSWAPPQSNYYNDQTFTQTSNCGTTRTVYGSVARPSSCVDTAWWPPGTDYYTDQYFWQTSNCNNTRYVAGTTPVPQQCSNDLDMRGFNPNDYYVDQCDTFYTGCGAAQQVCGTMTRQPVDVIPRTCTMYFASGAYGYANEANAIVITSFDPNDFNNQINNFLNYLNQMNMNLHSYYTGTEVVPC